VINVSDEVVQKFEPHFIFNHFFPNIVPFKTMLKNKVQLGRPQMMLLYAACTLHVG